MLKKISSYEIKSMKGWRHTRWKKNQNVEEYDEENIVKHNMRRKCRRRLHF